MPTTMTPGWVAYQAPDTVIGTGADAGSSTGDPVAEFHETTKLTPALHRRSVRPIRRPPRERSQPGAPLEMWHLPTFDGANWVLGLLARVDIRPLFCPMSPVEIYVSVPVANAHYDQVRGRFDLLPGAGRIAACHADPAPVEDADAVIHVTVIRERTGVAPPGRAYRLALMEAAVVLRDIQLACASAKTVSDSFDTRIERLLGVDGFHEVYAGSLAIHRETP